MTFNNGQSSTGGGMSLGGNAVVDIELCVFSNDRATSASYGGGGIYVKASGATVHIFGTLFVGNLADSGKGGDVFRNGGTIQVHEGCPSPYASNNSTRGPALDTQGTVLGAARSFSLCPFYTCSTGHYNPTRGPSMTDCVKCAVGKHGMIRGATNERACEPCPANQFSSIAGSSFCIACDEGMLTPGTGTISQDSCFIPNQTLSPTPAPTVPPTPAPTATPPPPPTFALTQRYASRCSVHGACFSSLVYATHEYCSFTSTSNGTLLVITFETEENLDMLTVGGVDYTGTSAPDGVVVWEGDEVIWYSSADTKEAGFNICLKPLPEGYEKDANLVIDGGEKGKGKSGSFGRKNMVLYGIGAAGVIFISLLLYFTMKCRARGSKNSAGNPNDVHVASAHYQNQELAVVAPAVEMVAVAVEATPAQEHPQAMRQMVQQEQEADQWQTPFKQQQLEQQHQQLLPSVPAAPAAKSGDLHDQALRVEGKEVIFERDQNGDRITLGKGQFGRVLAATCRGKRVAFKEVLETSLSEETIERFLLEMNLIGTLKHPNIVQCLGVVWEAASGGILFELCRHGALDEFMRTHHETHLLSWRKQAARHLQKKGLGSAPTEKDNAISSLVFRGLGLKTVWALGIAKGCDFLHTRSPPIIHRDLKCSNILVNNDFTAKISDFGESRMTETDANTMTTVGTPYFMAPEVFDDDQRIYSVEVDIYSFGVLLLEIVHDGYIEQAFNGMGAMMAMSQISRGWRPDLTSVRIEDRELAAVIERCWHQDPLARPSFKELITFFERRAMMLEMETERGGEGGQSPARKSNKW